MNNFKKLGIFLSLVIIGIFSYQESKAAIEFQQPISATTTASNIVISYQSLGNLESGHLINSIQIAGKTNTNTFAGNIFLTTCFFGTFSTTLGNCSGGTGSIQANIPIQPDPTNTTFYTLNFLSATTTNSAHEYAIQFASGGGFGLKAVAGSVNSSIYPNGIFVKSTGGALEADFNVKDAYFKLGSDLPTPNSTGQTIEFNFPTDFQITPDFGNWNIFYDIPATTTPKSNFFIDILYGNTTIGDLSDTTGINNYADSSLEIHKGNPLPESDYFAQAQIRVVPFTGSIIDIVSTPYIVASSTLINFSILNSASTTEFYTPPALTTLDNIFNNFATTTGNVFDQCEQLAVNAWQAGVCNVFTFLFQPHTTSLDNIKSVLTSFQDIFPFNIFFSIQNDLKDSFNAGVANQTFLFTLPIPGGTTTPLLTPTILEDNLGTSSKNKIFEIQAYIMWIALAVRIYTKIT